MSATTLKLQVGNETVTLEPVYVNIISEREADITFDVHDKNGATRMVLFIEPYWFNGVSHREDIDNALIAHCDEKGYADMMSYARRSKAVLLAKNYTTIREVDDLLKSWGSLRLSLSLYDSLLIDFSLQRLPEEIESKFVSHGEELLKLMTEMSKTVKEARKELESTINELAYGV